MKFRQVSSPVVSFTAYLLSCEWAACVCGINITSNALSSNFVSMSVCVWECALH